MKGNQGLLVIIMFLLLVPAGVRGANFFRTLGGYKHRLAAFTSTKLSNWTQPVWLRLSNMTLNPKRVGVIDRMRSALTHLMVQSNEVPFTADASPPIAARKAPIGIENNYGTCYASATLQFLEAMLAAAPELMGSLIVPAQDGLVGAFKATRDAAKKWQDESAEPFVQEWLRQNHDHYATFLRKVRKNKDGSVSAEEHFPEHINRASGGYPVEMTKNFLAECDRIAQQRGTKSPFTIVSNRIIQQHSDNGPWRDDPIAVPGNPFSGVRVREATKFLIFDNTYKERLVPEFDIEVPIVKNVVTGRERTTQKYDLTKQKYRLVGLMQFKFAFDHDFFYQHFWSSGHVICYARYNEQWFMCNDDDVVPVAAGKVQADLDEDARMTCEGRAVSYAIHPLYDYPLLMVYERVD